MEMSARSISDATVDNACSIFSILGITLGKFLSKPLIKSELPSVYKRVVRTSIVNEAGFTAS